jgi:hypothetical protein
MKDNRSIFLYTVNVHGLSQDFIDKGKGDKYYEYESKGFYGAVIRSEEPLQRLQGERVVLIVHPRYSDGSFQGTNIDIVPRGSRKIHEYDIDITELMHVQMEVKKNPGNIVINGKPTLTSLFFHDHYDKETTIINFVSNGRV